MTDDVFTSVAPEGIPYQPHPGFVVVSYSQPTLEIGDPWSYYHKFWQAHGLEHLANIVHVSRDFVLPLVIQNPLNTPISVDLSVKAPKGFAVAPVAPASVPAHGQYYARVQATSLADKLPGSQQFTVSAESGGKNIGTVPLRVELSSGWGAPQ